MSCAARNASEVQAPDPHGSDWERHLIGIIWHLESLFDRYGASNCKRANTMNEQ